MISFGSDPEFMLGKDGQMHSAIGIVQGDIENRIDINGHQFYYDNVMAECAIKPATSKTKTINNFRECLQLYANMVSPYQLVAQASHTFATGQLRHPDARQVGCAPDYCAYRLELVDAPKESIQGSGFRSCGGHIHIGHPILRSDGPEPIIAVYLLDLFLAVPSLWLDDDPTSITRRTLYGQAGRYRSKDYGIEYRSLGNFWLQSPNLVAWVHGVCQFVVRCLESGAANDLWSFDEEALYESENPSDAFTPSYDAATLRAAVDAGNQDQAQLFYDLSRQLLPSKLVEELDALIEMPQDLYASWCLS